MRHHEIQRLRVQIGPEGVEIADGLREKHLSEMWSVFYGLLVLATDHGEWVTEEELNEYQPWSTKRARSSGRQVLHHLASLRKAGYPEVVSPDPKRGRTKRWRLDRRVVVCSAFEDLHGWLDSRKSVDQQVPGNAWITWAVRGLLELHQGETRLSVKSFKQAAKGRSAHARIARFYALIAAQRSSLEPQAFGIREGDWGDDPVGKALAPRASSLGTFYAYLDSTGAVHSYSSGNLGAAMSALSHDASRLGSHGDFGGAGLLLCRLGLLARRAGDFPRAERVLKEAVGLLLLSGDVWHLQATLFNLCHTRYQKLLEDGQEIDDETIALLRLECTFRSKHRLGMDSAQSEILLVSIFLSRGEIPLALAYIKAAESILAVHPDSYDHGCLLRQRSSLAALEGRRDEAISLLEKSIEYIEDSGRTTKDLRELLKRYKREERSTSRVANRKEELP